MAEETNEFELLESQDAMELVPLWEPEIWWFVAGFLVIGLLVFLLVLLCRRKPVVDPDLAAREAYDVAKRDFDALPEDGPRELAVGISLILRRYLATSLGEPALFETHEEFVARHESLDKLIEGLRPEVAEYFSRLAALKYSPGDGADAEPGELRAAGRNLLERIHNNRLSH